MKIDLQSDIGIAEGRLLVEQLVGAHMAAVSEDELLTMVNLAMSELNHGGLERTLRVLVHAIYHAQSLIVTLLEIATSQTTTPGRMERWNHGDRAGNLDRVGPIDLELWDRVRDSSVVD